VTSVERQAHSILFAVLWSLRQRFPRPLYGRNSSQHEAWRLYFSLRKSSFEIQFRESDANLL
jgi:hypothetical protein